MGSYTEMAQASWIANHQVLVAQQTYCILATDELDDTQLLPQWLLAGYKGQVHAERGCGFLKDPYFWLRCSISKNPNGIWRY